MGKSTASFWFKPKTDFYFHTFWVTLANHCGLNTKWDSDASVIDAIIFALTHRSQKVNLFKVLALPGYGHSSNK